MECAKTLEDHSFTCQPCALAAAGSSRLRHFNLSLGKADVSGSWRTWEVTTANSLRGLYPTGTSDELHPGRPRAEGAKRPRSHPSPGHIGRGRQCPCLGLGQRWRKSKLQPPPTSTPTTRSSHSAVPGLRNPDPRSTFQIVCLLLRLLPVAPQHTYSPQFL